MLFVLAAVAKRVGLSGKMLDDSGCRKELAERVRQAAPVEVVLLGGSGVESMFPTNPGLPSFRTTRLSPVQYAAYTPTLLPKRAVSAAVVHRASVDWVHVWHV